MTLRTRSAFRIAALGLLLVAVALYIRRHWGTPWDFETFYWAAAAALRGLDPYSLMGLNVAAGKTVELPYLYPPAALLLFAPFTGLSFTIAAATWLFLKIGLLGILIVLWRRTFVPDAAMLALCAIALLGFDAAALWDLRTGNVAIVEALLLWLGFACYVFERRWAAAVLIALAASFKLLPIVFVALLLLPSRRHGPSPGRVVAALVLFSAIVFLPVVLGPEWAHRFLRNLPAQRPYGEVNPSALGLLDGWLDHGQARGWDRALAGWALFDVVLVAASLGALRRTWAERDPRRWVAIGCLLFGLLAPRMIVYSYILLAVPSLMLVHDLFPRPGLRGVAVALLCAQGAVRLLPESPTWPVLGNLPFLLALALWLLYLARDGRPERTAGRRFGSAASRTEAIGP